MSILCQWQREARPRQKGDQFIYLKILNCLQLERFTFTP